MQKCRKNNATNIQYLKIVSRVVPKKSDVSLGVASVVVLLVVQVRALGPVLMLELLASEFWLESFSLVVVL